MALDLAEEEAGVLELPDDGSPLVLQSLCMECQQNVRRVHMTPSSCLHCKACFEYQHMSESIGVTDAGSLAGRNDHTSHQDSALP